LGNDILQFPSVGYNIWMRNCSNMDYNNIIRP
jgi:hypothetical protein